MEFGIVNAECGKGKDSIAECANGNAEMGAESSDYRPHNLL
jgi:hypothetical protein